MAKENLGAQQLRYKKAYDSHVRALTAEISPGDLGYVRSYVSQKDLSRKLIFPAVGPFEDTRVSPDRRTLSVRTPEREATVPADRVRKCESPRDIPTGMQFLDPPSENTKSNMEFNEYESDMDDLSEYLIDRIVSHRRAEDGQIRLRIRWFWYDSSQDPWEPVVSIPDEILRRYVRRRHLRPEDYGLTRC
jgi:hypothetical protein